MEVKVEVHTVHPTSPTIKPGIKAPKKVAYGSWCTPETSPIKKLKSDDCKIQGRDDPVQCKSTFKLQQVKLIAYSPPPKAKFVEADYKICAENDDRKSDKILDEPLEVRLPSNDKKPYQEIDQPQSPVPSSPTRNKNGLKLLKNLKDLILPIDPQGRRYISWLLLVTFCYSYNAWCIFLRATFPYQTPDNLAIWMTMDYFCDVIYLIDVYMVKPKLMFLHEGFWVDDPEETKKNYLRKTQSKFDVISMLPLDILYIFFGTDMVILRLPRLLKLQTFWEFHQAMDRVLSSPYVIRIGKTLFYIFFLIHLNACAYYAMSAYIGLGSNGWVYDNQGNAYIRCFYFATKVRIGKTLFYIFFLIHLNACAYYAMSAYIGLGSNGWVYDNQGNAYIRCFYFATKTATSIGKNPKPENTIEYLFMTAAWLMGVFVFALLIGQIRDIIATATRARAEYRKTVDNCIRYLRRLNMPKYLQRRVTCWFNYTWNKQRCFDEEKILDALPFNMKRDVALAVHMGTLSKVQLFRDCSTSLLRDLVLQLRSTTFLPGEMVVRRGDVGHHMYIVQSGECCVMSADESEVLATLKEGSVFGEISLLGIDGLRHRTATVRSRGYSNLFALSRNDLNTALQHHKQASKILRLRADQLIRENAARQATKKAGPAAGRRRSFAPGGRRHRTYSSISRRRLSVVSEDKNTSTKTISHDEIKTEKPTDDSTQTKQEIYGQADKQTIPTIVFTQATEQDDKKNF